MCEEACTHVELCVVVVELVLAGGGRCGVTVQRHFVSAARVTRVLATCQEINILKKKKKDSRKHSRIVMNSRLLVSEEQTVSCFMQTGSE